MSRPLSAEGLEEVRAPMTESFWFLTGEDGPEGDAERPELSGTLFDARDVFAPYQESMRGDRSRPQRAPSTDQKRVRRQIHRSGVYTEGHDAVNWDEAYPLIHQHADNGELHRGLGLDLPDELHQYVHDSSKPVHERAAALLDHIAGEDARDYSGDSERLGLGMHWSMNRGQAQIFAHENGPLHAASNFDQHVADEDNLRDFTYGVRPGDVNADKLAEHLFTHHNVPYEHQDRVTPWPERRHEDLAYLHRNEHRRPMPGQTELFSIDRSHRDPRAQDRHIDLSEGMRDPEAGRARPATEIVLSTPVPPRDAIDESPATNPNAGGEVYHPFSGGEYEVPLKAGAKIPITQISWTKVHHGPDAKGEDAGMHWTHHRFGEPEHREARKTAAYGTDRMPPHERVTDWDDVVGDHDTSDWRIHRGVKLWPKGDLWDRVNDESRPVHERAHELIKHITSERGNLGMHWSSDEDFAKQVAKDGGWSAIGNNGAPKDMEYALSMPVVVHARWPHKEHFETDPNELHANHVLPYGYSENLADEWETPLKKGAPVHITGVTWSSYDNPRKHEWTHHSFDEPIKHTATVLNTQVERLNKGDQIRTPTGQTSHVQKIRPHETDSTLMYLDTDMGTSTVKRGTDFQVVPRNSQQQELPDTGNPMGGNFFELPGAGKSPGGEGSGSAAPPSVCPNCGNTGTFHLQGSNFICAVCGFTSPAGGSPGNLMFTNQPSGHLPARRKPGEIPRAHVWASKYSTFDQDSQIARRARRVSGGDQ